MPFSRGRKTLCLVYACWAFAVAAPSAQAQDIAPDAGRTTPPHAPEALVDNELESLKLDRALQGLKDEAIQFHSDAEIAEEDYLYPLDTRLSVYVSNQFDGLLLDNVTLTIDDNAPIVHEYSQIDAYALLQDDSLHRLAISNVSRGRHRILLDYSGHIGAKDSEGVPLKGRYDGVINKRSNVSEFELRIQRGARRDSEPTVRLIEWSPAQ